MDTRNEAEYHIGLTSLALKPLIREIKQRLKLNSAEVDLLFSNPSRARQVLGWQPKVERREGMRRTLEFFRNKVKP